MKYYLFIKYKFKLNSLQNKKKGGIVTNKHF